MRSLPAVIRVLAGAVLLALAAYLLYPAAGAEGVDITFRGGAGEVGGSCTLVETGESSFLVDCGAFGSGKAEVIPPEPEDIEFMVLTHAHSDHCGMIPELLEAGFSGKVYCTPPTAELVPVMLRMARGFSRDRVSREAFDSAIESLEPVEFGETVERGPVSFVFRRAQHLLGAAFVKFEIASGGRRMRLVFSGDLGSGSSVLLKPLEDCPEADYVVMESTYGAVVRKRRGAVPSRLYSLFGAQVGRALGEGGDVLIPAFTLGRTQEVMAVLDLYEAEGVVPKGTLIYSDSPTAKKVTEIYRMFPEELSATAVKMYGSTPLEAPWHREVRSRTSLKVHERPHEPAVFISSSGNLEYANSPRHLVRMADRPENLLCLVGWQSPGSVGYKLERGDSLVVVRCREGGKAVDYGLAPRMKTLAFNVFSSHADADGLVDWLKGAGRPRTVFLVHGEPDQSGPLAERIGRDLGLAVKVPSDGDSFRLEYR